MNEPKKDILTIPNLLTVIRLLLVPVYAVMYMNARETKDYIIAASVLALSSLTDMVDGIIARKCNMVSRLGIMLDPFADKMTQGVIMICLTVKHIEILPLLALFIVKESFMLIMGCKHLKKGKMLDGALFAGKICTTVLFVSMIALVVFPDMKRFVRIIIVCVCSAFMLNSLYSYAKCYRQQDHIADVDSLSRDKKTN